MIFSEYLKLINQYILTQSQTLWLEKIQKTVEYGLQIYHDASEDTRIRLVEEYKNRVRTEELKAWYSAPEGSMLFQGTSISSLVVPCELSTPLLLNNITDLEDSIADNYIRLHDLYAERVKNAIIEDVDNWINEGLYYGILISSKIISQSFDLKILHNEVVFKVRGKLIDPHEILSYSDDIIDEYFQEVKARIRCFDGLDLTSEELKSSLILADISKPKIERYRDNILLAPIRCNELASILAHRIKELIIERSGGRIKPRSLALVIYDTDTPYTYHSIMGQTQGSSFILPGLTILGSSGSIDALRWLYIYRISLIGQKLMKSSLYSEVHRKFIPFVFYGVLVPRDAEILLDLERLDLLRYRSNMDTSFEFYYMLPSLFKYIKNKGEDNILQRLRLRSTI